MRKISLIIFVALIISAIFLSTGYAKGDQNFLRKGTRGVCNVVLGFLEVHKSVQETWEEMGPLGTATYGFAKGALKAAVRTLVGMYETATCLLPPYGPVLKDPEFFGSPDLDEQYPVTSGISGIVDTPEE